MSKQKIIALAEKISPAVLNAFNADHLCEGEVLAIDMTKSGFNRDFIGRTCGLTSRQLERLHTRCMSLNISLLQYCEEAEIDC